MLRFYIGFARFWAWSARREVNICDSGWRFHVGRLRFGAFYEPQTPFTPIHEMLEDAIRTGKGFVRVDSSELFKG